MELKIYDKANNLRLTASPNSSSTVTEEIGGECSVSASFTHTAYVPLDVDDYIDLEGVRYKVKSRYRPKQKNTQTYEYSVKFYAPLHDAEDTLMLFQEGGTTSEFSYDGSAREHLQLWIDNMNRRAGAKLWSIGTVIDSGSKTISYRNVKCWDAAFGSNGIASTFDTEMWADGYVINLCKAERGETVELGYLHGLTNLAQEDNGEVKFFTRLFPLGSTRNIDATKYGYSRLQLPDRSLYVDKNVDLYGVKEETEEAAFSTIFPKYVGTVSSVRTEEKISEEGRKYIIYYFKDNDMTWDPKDYEIPDLDYMLQFQTGELAGRGTNGSFQAAWHEDTKEWEIINVYPDETTQIPGGVIVPNPGDQYIPWNFAMPQEYITAAEQEYKQAVNDFLNTYSFDPNKYNGTTDRNYIEKNGTPLRIGWNVRLLSEQYFGSTGGYKNTRIIKVQRKLNDLCQATITCSDEVGSGWKSSVDNSLGSLQDANHNLSQSYEKLHNDMMEGFASIKNLWELKQDDYGNYYIYTKYNIFGRKGITSYVEADVKVPSVFDGLPLDNTTIRKNPETGLIEVIGGTGTSFDENAMWSALSGSSNNQINKSHLTTVLAEYATAESVSALTTELNKKWTQDDTKIKNWDTAFGWGDHSKAGYAHLANEEAFTGLKHFTAGLSVGESKKKIYEENGVVYIDADVAVTGAMTFYASAGRSVSTIMDGVTVDEETITKGSDNVLRIKNAGAGSSFDENAMWSALSGSSDNQINKSHLTNALAGYATESWVTGKGYATESWVASKNYATTEALNAVSNKLNDFLEGSDADTIINKWKELEAFLSGMAETDNLAEILETKADKKYVDSTFVTLATKQTITGEKTFSSVLNTAAIKASGAITAPSLAVSDWVTIAGIKLRKLEDGALMLEGNLALTGGLTTYASDGVSFASIYDGLPIDNDTIYWQEVEGSKVLKAKEGSGSSFDKSAMWTALAGSTTEQINKSHLTTALTGYATESWVSGKNYAVKATTLAGYGITDGINAVSVTGTGNAVTAASISGHTLTLTKGATFNNYTHPTATATTITAANGKVLSAITVNNQGHVTSVSGKTLAAADIPTLEISKISGLQDSLDAKLESSAYTAADVLAKLKTVDGSNSGLDADLLDGTHKTALFTALTSSSATNISITVGGTTKSIADLFANSAAKLETARTIWGQSFDGTKPVTGALTSVTDITGTGTFTGANLKATDSVYVNGIRLHKTADGVITLEGNLAVTGGITTYAIDPVSVSTVMDGVVVDGTTIKKENGKLVAVGGGEAGNVAWDNISGKPSVFPTNIANITDLHSSWDSVLAAQKPAWLTAVSIATISDLHANWDALLKATPSAYVTRWPTISEVTGKQNLVVKLNGGTTEGTNQFTYNATGAKTINITPAGIGAAASSHNHSWSNITSGKPTTLAGYGITDAPTKTGSGASGTWGIGITGNAATASKWATARTITLGSYLSGSVSLDGSVNVTLNANVLGLTSQGNKTAATGNTSPASGVRLYQVYNNGYPTTYGNLLSVKGGGAGELLLSWNNANRIYYRSLRDNGDNWLGWNELAFITDNVASATKLKTARTLWGRSFDGTGNVSGNLDNVGNINTIGGTINAKVFAYNPSDNHDGLPWYGMAHYGNNVIAISGYGGIELFTSAGNVLAIGTDNKVYANSYVASNSFRSTGDTGWYNEKWGGGWYMSDSNFLRSTNEKSVYIGNGSYRTAGGGYAANNINNASEVFSCRFMSESIAGIPAGNIRNILGWYDSAASGWTTSYIIGSKRNYNNDWGEMTFGVYRYEGSSRSMRMLMTLDGAGQKLYIEGNILATGGSSFYGSDIRYKSIIHPVMLLALNKIAEAPSFVYRWNRPNMNQNRLNLGGSAQYTQSILPWAVENSNNFLSMDYATVAYTFAVHTARHLMNYETRTDKKIKKLENRVKYLEKQLKKLGYEEVRTLDDSGI